MQTQSENLPSLRNKSNQNKPSLHSEKNQCFFYQTTNNQNQKPTQSTTKSNPEKQKPKHKPRPNTKLVSVNAGFMVSDSGKAYIFLCSCLIQDVTCYMKVVQTTLTEAEHKLLEEYAKRNSMSIKDVLREAVRTTLEGNTNPNDPIFTCPPSSKRTGKKDHTSEEHDKYLYGENT